MDKPETKRIEMNDGIYGDSNSLLETVIGGCYGIMVYTNSDDVGREGLLLHYSPDDILQFHPKLKSLVQEHPHMKDSPIKKAVVLYNLGNDNLDYIEAALKTELGGNIEIEKREYRTDSSQYFGVENRSGRLAFNVGEAFWILEGNFNDDFE